jgi:hypothetical protein
LFRLPRRDLGRLRSVGALIALFGLAGLVFLGFWVWGPLSEFLESDDGFRWLLLGFALLATPGIVITAGFVALGLAILTNATRCEITVGRERIWVRERFGPFRVTWKRRLDQITRIVIQDMTAAAATRGAGARAPAAVPFAALALETPPQRPLVAAVGYDRVLLRHLADELVDALPERGGTLIHDDEAEVPVVEVDAEDGVTPEPDSWPKPEGSRAVYEERPDGFQVRLPPAGLLRGGGGLFVFALFWETISTLFLWGLLVAEERPPWFAFLFILAFHAVGAGMLLAAIHLGSRRAVLGVAGTAFAFRQKGLFGTREYRLDAAEIAAVRVGPSGMEVNNRPVMELQIHRVSGRKVGVLSMRPDDELEWLAWLIRRSLGVPRT